MTRRSVALFFCFALVAGCAHVADTHERLSQDECALAAHGEPDASHRGCSLRARGNEDEDEGEESARSESAKEWLLHQLGGPTGVVDAAAVSHALEQRAQILTAPRPKRAALPSTPSGWTNLTGYTQSSGRINDILFTSSTGNDILAGADGGGIWRTTDGGTSWTPLDDFLGSLSITNFAKATNDPNTIYAATNERGSHTYFPFGILKSTDGGATWTSLASTNPASNADFTYVQRVAVHPTNSSMVLAATHGGAYLSTNGGTTWTKVGNISTTAYYVAFHPTDGNRAAIAYNDGTVRYTTTGDLLGAGALTSTVLSGGNYMKIAYAKSDASRMYALLSDGSGNSRLFMSQTSGASWTEVSSAALVSNGTFFNGYYLRFTGGLWVDPLNANRVAVCEGWASFTADITAGPPAWKKLYSGWVDFHGIVEHPGYDGVANKSVFFMDDGGLYRIGDIDNLDLSGQFTRLENGLTVTEVYSVSDHGGNPILGAQDVAPKVYRTDIPGGDASNKWRFLSGNGCPTCSWVGDGTTTAASKADPSVLYGSRQYLDMIRSTDGGVTAASIVAGSALNEGGGAGNQNAAFVAPFVLDPSNQSRMLAGGQSLWRSNDVDTGNPPTWTAIRAPLGDTSCGSASGTISTIAIAPSNPDVVWLAQTCSGRLFKSVNATQATPTWSEITTFPVAAAKGAITIDPVDPNIVWVGLAQYNFTNTLYKTTDGGTSWAPVAGLPSAPVYALLQHPSNRSWLYAGTGVGLFASDDGGATWSTSNEGPANVVVRSLDWNTSASAPQLVVGTFGRGVFTATVGANGVALSATALGVVSTASVGDTVSLQATVSGSVGTPTGSVVFRDGGIDIATVALNGTGNAVFTTATLSAGIHHLSALYLGDATYAGSASSVATLTIGATDPPRLGNISTRMAVLTGNNVMIAGFIIGGSTNKTLAITATGPSLAAFGISNFLANPSLRIVRSSDQTTIATNDDWQTDANAGLLQASGFAPGNSKEAGLYISLPPGAYTAIVSGVGSTTGVSVVGVFEVDHPEIPLVNISTRGFVQTGSNVMIGGFIVNGSGPQTVAITATGPSLAPFGISNFLANPQIQLVRSSDQAVLATNDDWQSDVNAAQLQASGFAPGNSKEPGLFRTLDPGAYTVIVSGVGGTTGVAVVGVFTAP